MDKKILYGIFSIIVFIAICTVSFILAQNKKVTEPFFGNYKIEDTETHIETSFNDKYKIIRINLTIDEVIEDWQIDSIGENIYMTLICETPDRTIKKEYYFDNVKLKKGDKLKGSLIIEDAKLKDYSLLKELLKGNIKIEISEYLSLNAQTRSNLQKEYYNQRKEVIIVEKEVPVEQTKTVAPEPQTYNPHRKNNNNEFLNNLFNF